MTVETYTETLIGILDRARIEADALYSVVPGREHWWVYVELAGMVERLRTQKAFPEPTESQHGGSY